MPMKSLRRVFVPAACFLALLFLHESLLAQDMPAAGGDEAAIRSVNPAWFKAHKAGDVNTIVGFYADDAVVGAPGASAARGRTAIHEFFTKDVAATAKDGLTLTSSPTTEVGVSGNLGWEWGTFTVMDKSGAVVDKGKFLTLFQKRDGKWLI